MSQQELVEALIADHGTPWSEEIGADIARDVPQPWFHWLLAAQLMSAPIHAGQAARAAAGLKAAGLHKIEAILESDRETRIRVLNESGYARFDNRGADYIFAAAELVRERWGGDLRRLAEEGGDRAGILRALTRVKGIGEAGAAIFAREAQIAWDALYPMLDDAAAEEAGRLGLPREAEALAELAGSRERFVRLAAALVRVALDGPSERVQAAA
ncbi:hypothetical protein [Salipiger mucosus]|uniref:Uncharacterized protein n=1 Tax=Salipiger mucosus DSM 16094 TaxID=1123237 RepID=S9RRZ6_9RHOB|nr:hypothetical protein [Salipiger mucosus]EPX76739.1 hypothetical protein Salmuc_05279 [Salipiger mucosus DSM 16094]